MGEAFDMDDHVSSLLEDTTPDELFDFFEEQGMFDNLKSMDLLYIPPINLKDFHDT